jgi:hypothetical protein
MKEMPCIAFVVNAVPACVKKGFFRKRGKISYVARSIVVVANVQRIRRVSRIISICFHKQDVIESFSCETRSTHVVQITFFIWTQDDNIEQVSRLRSSLIIGVLVEMPTRNKTRFRRIRKFNERDAKRFSTRNARREYRLLRNPSRQQ